MSTPIQQLFDLHGSVALVTGGSRGLGLQMAEALGEAGARLMLTSRKAAELEPAAAAFAARGIEAQWFAADATDPAQVGAVVAATQARFGAIDILVNNAGTNWGAPAESYPLEAWDKVMNLNLRSVFLYSQAVARAAMIPRRSGRIVNVSSIAGLAGSLQLKYIAYATSKGALVNFTRQLAGEWGPYGINVNALAPGFFLSKMTAEVLKDGKDAGFAAAAPLGRLGDEDDLKGAIVLLASRAGKHITGQVLAVDGGVDAVHLT